MTPSAGHDERIESRNRVPLAEEAKTMNRPTLEVADIIRAHGKRFVEHRRSWARITPGFIGSPSH